MITGAHDDRDPMPLTQSPIRTGQQAWAAAGVFHPRRVRPERRRGGAISVVTRPLNSPWRVCAGNPCKMIQPRRGDRGPDPFHV